MWTSLNIHDIFVKLCCWQDGFKIQIRINGLFLGKWMTLAFFIKSLMIIYIPAGFITGLVGIGNIMAIPTSAMIRIPAYMNGYAAIPLISGLVELDMAPGAVMSLATAERGVVYSSRSCRFYQGINGKSGWNRRHRARQ